MNIQDVLDDYKKNKVDYIISEKQKKFIKSLVRQVYNSNNIFLHMSNLLEKNINSWQDIACNDVKIVISKLMNRKPASVKQIEMIKRLYNIERINETFKTNFTDYDQLNHWHIKRLLTTPSKFNLRPSDHPIHCESDYEYGYQDSALCPDNRMYYLKFYDLLMLDYDNITYDEVIEKLEDYEDCMYFRIYQTFNGYHVFLMSQLYPHNSNASSNLMTALGCDNYYVMFCYRNGYKIRLTPKLNRNETYVVKYHSNYGNADLLNPGCDDLIKIHDNFFSH